MQSIQGPLPHCLESSDTEISTRVPRRSLTPEHYTAITDALIDFDLTPTEFKLAVILLSYRWFETSPIIPSVKLLADRLRRSERTVQYTLASLEEKALFIVRPCYRPDGGQMSNHFEIGPALLPLLAPAPEQDCTTPRNESHPPTQWPAGKRTQRNHQNRTTRNGTANHRQPGTGGQCFGCGGPHMTTDCQHPSYRGMMARRR